MRKDVIHKERSWEQLLANQDAGVFYMGNYDPQFDKEETNKNINGKYTLK